ncbi:hypothetical protein PHMEG_00029271 [Phytophthora megakarya]|uniref:Uncharacterized protein n=1 Tax=Phytophthora megakarya TaxID=4795 RepID=A0A225V309_9STRA|nr:hypothetical protein PHMEG_00029271 [Phytophthora megakarya]
MLHPEQKPKWMKDSQKKKIRGSEAVSKTGESSDEKLWSALNSIQSDLAKIKGDLNYYQLPSLHARFHGTPSINSRSFGI